MGQILHGTARNDSGREATSDHLQQWAQDHNIEIDFITPGCPVENGIIESFNGRFRDECFNLHWFENLAEAQRLIEEWR